MTSKNNSVETHSAYVYNPGQALKWIIIQCNNLVTDGDWGVGTEREIAICRGAVLDIEVSASDNASKKAVIGYSLLIKGYITLDDYNSIKSYCQSVWHDEYEDITPERWWNYVEV